MIRLTTRRIDAGGRSAKVGLSFLFEAADFESSSQRIRLEPSRIDHCSPSRESRRLILREHAGRSQFGTQTVGGIEHDLRETAQNIETSKCMLYVLSGDYDWSAYPEAAQELADKVPGATYTLMEGMGHFPMSENPVLFREYLLPVLDRILEET